MTFKETRRRLLIILRHIVLAYYYAFKTLFGCAVMRCRIRWFEFRFADEIKHRAQLKQNMRN